MKSLSSPRAPSTIRWVCVPGGPLPQHRLAHPPQKKRLEQRLVALMEQQVAMVLAIGGQGRIGRPVPAPPGPAPPAERPRNSRASVPGPDATSAPGPARWLPPRSATSCAVADFARSTSIRGEQLVDVPQEPRIGRPRGEVEIAENILGGFPGFGAQSIKIHQHYSPDAS